MAAMPHGISPDRRATPIPKLLRCAQCGEIKKRRYFLGAADRHGSRPILRLCRACRQVNAMRKETKP